MGEPWASLGQYQGLSGTEEEVAPERAVLGPVRSHLVGTVTFQKGTQPKAEEEPGKRTLTSLPLDLLLLLVLSLAEPK